MDDPSDSREVRNFLHKLFREAPDQLTWLMYAFNVAKALRPQLFEKCEMPPEITSITSNGSTRRKDPRM